jgi:MIP family channel proteins
MIGELLAEFLGTMVLITFGCGVNAMVSVMGLGTFFSINAGWGLGVTMGIYVAGRVSGAHMNPAVTLALAAFKGFPWRKVAPYSMAQTAGAFVGALIVFINYRPGILKMDPTLEKTAGTFATFPAFPGAPMTGLFDQIIGTGLLVLLIFAIIDEKNQPSGALAPSLIGLVVVAIGLCFGGVHGYAINPARDFGPRLMTVATGFPNNGLTDGSGVFWVPILGPLLGGLLGGAIWKSGIQRYLPAAVVILLLALPLGAQTVAIKAARLFDGKSNSLQQPGIVVVTGQRIESAGPSTQIPAGARVIDLGDATILPGFMDAHTHLTQERSHDSARDFANRMQMSIPEQTLNAAVLARKTLMAGFTTVRNLGANDFVDVGLRNAIQRGVTEGPRILTAVRGIGTTGGHCDPTNGFRFGLLNPGQEPPSVGNGPDAIRAAVRWNIKYGADVIKVCATGGVLSLNDDVDSPQLTQEELDALVDQAHSARKKAAAHAHGAEGAKRAIRAGIDSIEHGSFMDEEALNLMIKKGTFYVPTLMAIKGIREQLAAGSRMDPRQERKARLAMDSIDVTVRKAISMGVRIAFGTDSGVFPHGRNGEEFQLLVERGMTPVAALKSATSADAELFGIADRTGSIESGKLADIVAVPGDVLADIRATEKVFFVMKEGRVFRNDRGGH